MSIKTIQKFITDDGREHATLADARKHETFLELRGVLQSNIPSLASDRDAASFGQQAKAILTNPEVFASAILRSRKRLNNVKKITLKAGGAV